jgi:hypothetical protein
VDQHIEPDLFLPPHSASGFLFEELLVLRVVQLADVGGLRG